jgi:hypothetical protein
VGPFGLVELEGPGDRVADGGGRAGQRPSFQLGIVLDAHPGQGGDLAPAQAGDPPTTDVGQARLLGASLARREMRNSRTSARLSTSSTMLSRRCCVGSPVSTRLERDSLTPGDAGFLGDGSSTATSARR